MKETTRSKLRDLWAIRRRCKEIEAEECLHSAPQRQDGSLARRRPLLSRAVIVAFAACFLTACLLHMRDMWRHGWLPYHSAPLPINCYWTALVILDLITAVLLLFRPRVGLLMSLLIMTSDVAVNLFARVDLHLLRHARGVALLLLQFSFLALIAGAAGLFREAEAG